MGNCANMTLGSPKKHKIWSRFENVELVQWSPNDVNVLTRALWRRLPGKSGKTKWLLEKMDFTTLFEGMETLPKDLQSGFYQLFDTDMDGKINAEDFFRGMNIVIRSDQMTKIHLLGVILSASGPNSSTNLDDAAPTMISMEAIISIRQFLVKRTGTMPKVEGNSGLTLEEFRNWAMTNVDIARIFGVFKILPSKRREKKAVKDLLRIPVNSSEAGVYYAVSGKWWQNWRTYVKRTHRRVNGGAVATTSQTHGGGDDFESVIDEEEERNRGEYIPAEMEGHNVMEQVERLKTNPNNRSHHGNSIITLGSNKNIPRTFELPPTNAKHESQSKHGDHEQENHDDLINEYMIGSPSPARNNNDEGGNLHDSGEFSLNFDKLLQSFNTSRIFSEAISPEYRNGEPNGAQSRPVPLRDLGNPHSGRPGPIDNSDIEGEWEGTLKYNLMINRDCILLPPKAWNYLYDLYGGGPVFCRDNKNAAPEEAETSKHKEPIENSTIKRRHDDHEKGPKRVRVDLYPVVLKVLLYSGVSEISPAELAVLHVSSRRELAGILPMDISQMKGYTVRDIAVYTKKPGEIWRRVNDIGQNLRDLGLTSGDFVVMMKKEVERDFNTKFHWEMPDANRDKETGMTPSNGTTFSLDRLEIGDMVDVLDRNASKWVLGYVDEYKPEKKYVKIHILGQKYTEDVKLDGQKDGSAAKYLSAPRTKSLFGGTVLPGKQGDDALNLALKLRLVGLKNIGNTCFLNVIVQPLLHTSKLSDYLISKAYKKDLNKTRKYLSETKDVLMVDEFAKLMTNVLVKNDKIQTLEIGLAKLTYFSPDDFKKILEIVMPMFSGYEQHDSQEFLSFFLDNLSEDLNRNATKKGEPESSYIKDLFGGKIVNKIRCLTCGKQQLKYEDFLMLSLALPMSNKPDMFLQITFVPVNRGVTVSRPRKIGLTLSNYNTFGDLMKQISKVTGVHEDSLVLLEVHNFIMLKSFLNKDRKTVIAQLGIRDTDNLFVYEIRGDRRDFEEAAYHIRDMLEQHAKPLASVLPGDYVDMCDHRNEWVTAIVKEVSPTDPKTLQLSPVGNNDTVINLAVNSKKLAPFTSKTAAAGRRGKDSAYLIECVHRRANKNNGRLETFGFPTMLAVPDWFSVRELVITAFNQIKRFIDMQHCLKKYLSSQNPSPRKKEQDGFAGMAASNQNPGTAVRREGSALFDEYNHFDLEARRVMSTTKFDPHEEIPNTNGLVNGLMKQSLNGNVHKTPEKPAGERNPVLSAQKNASQTMYDDFFFLTTPGALPFTVRALDRIGMYYKCAICHLPSNQIPGPERPDSCKGCPIALEDVILANWPKLMGRGFVLAFDWDDMYGLNIPNLTPEIHPTVEAMRELKRTTAGLQLEECFTEFTKKETLEIQCDTCKKLAAHETNIMIHALPEILILHFKRFYFMHNYMEKITATVNFPLEHLDLSKFIMPKDENSIEPPTDYELYSVTNHLGSVSGGHYTSYVKNQGYWVEYDDEATKVLEGNTKVMSDQAYILFYRRKER